MTEKKNDDKPTEKAEDKAPSKAETKSAEKAEEKAVAASEEHIAADDTEVPDRTGMRKAEAHRQAEVQRAAPLHTGDTSAVHPQPDRDTVGEQHSFAPLPAGERQVTEQPDRYAVGGEDAGEAVEPNAKNRRGRRPKKEEAVEDTSVWPAQYEGEGKDELPAQYSF